MIATSPGQGANVANVAAFLPLMAAARPHQRAIVAPVGRAAGGRVAYAQLTYAQLEHDSDRLAHGLRRAGVQRQSRVLMFVRPGLDFPSITFALYKLGAVPVLIDPGMPRKHLLACIEEARPEVMIGVPRAHLARLLRPGAFASVRVPIWVGGVLTFGGDTLDDLRRGGPDAPFPMVETRPDEPAAVLFTSGSTGPPKGVLYTHGMFIAQTRIIQRHYGIEPGEIDLPAFPLFALFSVAMGMTCVIPDMDPARPAHVDPAKIVEAIQNQGVTNSFGSPALWKRVGEHCRANRIRLPSIRRILMAGAPVAPRIMALFEGVLEPAARIHTPYGATESLPVASIDHREVLDDTVNRTVLGAGTCVGRPVPGMDVRIVKRGDTPIEGWSDAGILPPGEVGEIVVSGPVTTREYFQRPVETHLAKIREGERVWHRMGDLGYLDEMGRLWFCGRKAHCVVTHERVLYSVCCEAVFNVHPEVARTALVGLGRAPLQKPVLVVEMAQGNPRRRSFADILPALRQIAAEHEHTRSIEEFLEHPSFPVDTRHNVKIHREELARWAEARIGLRRPS